MFWTFFSIFTFLSHLYGTKRIYFHRMTLIYRTRYVSKGHGCPQFSTFVTKLKFFGWMDKSKPKAPLIEWGHKNMLLLFWMVCTGLILCTNLYTTLSILHVYSYNQSYLCTKTWQCIYYFHLSKLIWKFECSKTNLPYKVFPSTWPILDTRILEALDWCAYGKAVNVFSRSFPAPEYAHVDVVVTAPINIYSLNIYEIFGLFCTPTKILLTSFSFLLHFK